MTQPSIRRKLRLVILLTSAIVLLLACGAFIAADRARASRVLEHDLSSLAEMIGANSAAPLTFDDRVAGTEVLSALRARPAIVAAVMYTRSGQPFAIYGNPEPEQLRGLPTPTSTADRIEVVRGVFLRDEQVGSIYIASDLRDAVARLHSFAGMAAVILLLSLMVAYLLSWRLERVITRPILDLAGAAQQVTLKRNYSIRVAAPSTEQHDEIGALMIGFNGMLTEIQRRDDELRRHRDELEHEVESRTIELRGTNANLIAAKELAEYVAEINAQLSRQQQMILNAAGEGILGVDVGGVVTFINPSGATMFNQPVELLVGRPLHDLIHPADVRNGGFDHCPMCNRRSAVFTGGNTTHTFMRGDGARLPIEFIVNPIIDELGKKSGVVVTFRDITERLAIERMKSEFVSTVSHELRTPLTSIRGALGLLASGLLGDVGDRAKRMMNIAVSNTDRLVRLINDILDLERMESGRVELKRENVDAITLMREAIDVVQPIADGAGVTLVMKPVEAMLRVDHDRIVQTLTNLLGNAVKFSPGGTTVLLTGTLETDQFRFSVQDHGRGIPADKKDSIFERFRQVDASDSREKGGSGLGLAICRTIVGAHGGRLWVESRENEGSTFHFTLPVESDAAGDPTQAEADCRTIVICAANARAATALVPPIEKRGFKCVVIDATEQLVPAVLASRAEAVVVAVRAITDRGWTYLRALRANPATAGVPVVVASVEGASLVERSAALIARWAPQPSADGGEDEMPVAGAEHSVLVVGEDLDLARVITESLRNHGVDTIHAASGNEAIAACHRGVPTLVILDLAMP